MKIERVGIDGNSCRYLLEPYLMISTRDKKPHEKRLLFPSLTISIRVPNHSVRDGSLKVSVPISLLHLFRSDCLNNLDMVNSASCKR